MQKLVFSRPCQASTEQKKREEMEREEQKKKEEAKVGKAASKFEFGTLPRVSCESHVFQIKNAQFFTYFVF